MKLAFASMVAVMLVTMAHGGGASGPEAQEADWSHLALGPEWFADINPIAPGPYTGPGPEAVPPGWKSWNDDVHLQCGDYKLVFLNPDLQEDGNGIVHAQDRFFIQFQAVATGDTTPTEEITRFSFSFGKTNGAINNNQDLNCNDNLPETAAGRGTAGAYLLFYRSDFNHKDGFFVPIETRNVPDGEYAAAVHAYTGDAASGYTEVARAWAMATVKNCKSSTSIPNSCPDDTEADVRANDHTKPWPMVLPGDGEQTNGVDGLTIEVAEIVGGDQNANAYGPDLAASRAQAALDNGVVRAWLDKEELPLEVWTPPPRDRDLVPLNDDSDCPTDIRSVCEKRVYTMGWKWEGNIECDDIIRVWVKDLNDNEVSKQIHNCKTFGGVSTSAVPIIDWGNRGGSDFETVTAGDEHRFQMRLENVGGADAHVNLLTDYNASWVNAYWENIEEEHEHPEGHADSGETHVMIEPGETTNLDIVVETDPDMPAGVYPIQVGLEYLAAGEHEESWRDLELIVESLVEAPENETDEEDEEVDIEDSPGVGFVMVLLASTGLIAALLRRRG